MNSKMISQAIGAAVGTGIIGLIIGYLIYGKVAGDYVSLGTLFSFDKNMLESAVQSVAGIDAIRTKILTCGGVGAVVGLIARFLPALKK